MSLEPPAGPDLSGGREQGERMRPRTQDEVEHGRAGVGLPEKQFLFTIDQIALLLGLKEQTVRLRYLFYWGVSPGAHRKDLLRANNIAPVGDEPEWRVAEEELIRWLRHKRLRIY